jgi:hypothetical protein
MTFSMDKEEGLFFESIAPWSANPNSLYGLHHIFNEVNAGISLILFAALNSIIFWFISNIWGDDIEVFLKKITL